MAVLPPGELRRPIHGPRADARLERRGHRQSAADSVAPFTVQTFASTWNQKPQRPPYSRERCGYEHCRMPPNNGTPMRRVSVGNPCLPGKSPATRCGFPVGGQVPNNPPYAVPPPSVGPAIGSRATDPTHSSSTRVPASETRHVSRIGVGQAHPGGRESRREEAHRSSVTAGPALTSWR